jgi:hypothetical protein
MTPEEKAKKDLLDLQKLADQLGYKINNLWSNDPLSYANEITEAFVQWGDELNEINNDLNGLKSILESNLDDLTNSNVQLLKSRKTTRELVSITQQLQNEQSEILTLDKNQIEKLLKKATISKGLLSEAIKSGELTQEQIHATEDNLIQNDRLINILKERLELENKINEALGLTNALAGGLQQILKKTGFSRLSDQLGLDDAISKTREYAKELVKSQQESGNNGGMGTNLVNNLKTAGNLTKNLGANLAKSLGPLALIAMLVDAMMSLDKTSGEIAKQFGISYNEARGLNDQVNAIAYNTGNVFVDAQKINEAFMTLSNSLGTNTMLSGEMLVNFTELTQQAGYSVESATTLSKLSLITNKSSKDIAASYLGQVKLQNIKNKLAINEKALLNDINNTSKATLLNYSKNPAELGKAAFEAKKLGLELKQIESISNGLLDIESSIASEFESEVITGKQLNLERARYAALMGDLGGVAKELNDQNITFATYGKMNVIQQEAQAKALGMSREEMANMLMEQEAIRKVGAKDIGDLKEKLALAQAQGREAQFLNELGNETLSNQLKSTSAQERFQATMSKLQDIFTQIAEPLMPVLDIFGEIFTLLGPIISFISDGMAPAFKMVGVIVNAILDTLKGIVSIFSGGSFDYSKTASSWDGYTTALGNAPMVKSGKSIIGIDDGEIDSSGGLVVSGPKGSIQMDSEDTFVGNKNGITAGTDLFKEKDNGSITTLSNSLGNKMDVMINKLDNVVSAINRGMVVNLDGNKVSQELLIPLAIANRKV